MSPSAERPLLGVAEELISLLHEARETNLAAVGTLLHQRLRTPECFITVVGETSSGKSTLVNSCIGRPLLPAFARPTTAVVTHLIGLATPTAGDRYFSIFRDATQEEIDRNRFLALSESSSEDLLRLQVRFPAQRPAEAGLHLFDTPGFNSIIVAHEEVLRQFLPQSDLIVFVAGYRTGFGQSDQELLALVQQAREGDSGLPVILVVNRAPPGTTENDKRVREIRRNAGDCLRDAPETFIIESTTGARPESARSAPAVPVLPETGALWSRIRSLAQDPRRLATVQRKLAELLRRLWEEGAANLEQQVILLRGGAEEVRSVQARIALLHEARGHSLEAVARAMERLQASLPPSVQWHAEQVWQTLEQEIDGSEKWLGKEDCVAWLSGHALPFEVRRAGLALEDQIRQELERLDEELKQIANTAMMKLEHTVRVGGDAEARLAENLARNLAQRLGGSALHGLLRGMGGVGGAAAGAGNVVKMLVSRLGKLFDVTLGRGVYQQIGRMFTKRALERLNVAMTVLIEVVTFIRDAHRWKGQLKERVAKSLEEWREGLVQDLRDDQIPQIHEANVQGIHTIYDSLISDQERAIEEARSARPGQCEKMEALLTRWNELRVQLDPYLSQEPR